MSKDDHFHLLALFQQHDQLQGDIICSGSLQATRGYLVSTPAFLGIHSWFHSLGKHIQEPHGFS